MKKIFYEILLIQPYKDSYINFLEFHAPKKQQQQQLLQQKQSL